MKIPPIIVHSTIISNVKTALEQHLGVTCVKSCTIEEQGFAYIYFDEVDESETIDSFLAKLKEYTFSIEHENIHYTIESMYIDV